MAKKKKTAIHPTRATDYPEWYQQVVKIADLAEHAPVRGCMVIKPWGYALWENIQRLLDVRLKATGHQNAYFPLFIPLKFLEREAKHIEGFAKECAVVTHHRLIKNDKGQLIPASPLEEPLVVRPTSEMIIGKMFAKWIDSYRQLPLLINQWANVVRWEMRPRVFLRTAEFLWQEGHTAHATEEEARKKAKEILDLYIDFAENILAIPVIPGEKSASERFPGAVATYTFEAMMQDGKALQAGTSHFLGQNFARASEIMFSDPSGERTYPWMTSWGVTTRLIGGLIMVHGDDDGLILPPRIASAQIAIIPLVHRAEKREELLAYCRALKTRLENVSYHGYPLAVEIDESDARSGDKVWSWIKKGVPMRIEVGARELEAKKLSIAKRVQQHKEVALQTEKELLDTVTKQLDELQQELFLRAKNFRDRYLTPIETKDDFYQFFSEEKFPTGFASAHWNGDPAVEEQIKRDLNVTIRCIPFDKEKEAGLCPFTHQPSPQRVIFAKSY
ncbi:MAG: proline--tRNA ligase [Chlamydiota bacterium]